MKLIFDEEITNWKQIGGIDCPIATFRLEQLTELYTEEELGENYERAGDYESARGVYGLIAEQSAAGMIPGGRYAESLLRRIYEK